MVGPQRTSKVTRSLDQLGVHVGHMKLIELEMRRAGELIWFHHRLHHVTTAAGTKTKLQENVGRCPQQKDVNVQLEVWRSFTADIDLY